MDNIEQVRENMYDLMSDFRSQPLVFTIANTTAEELSINILDPAHIYNDLPNGVSISSSTIDYKKILLSLISRPIKIEALFLTCILLLDNKIIWWDVDDQGKFKNPPLCILNQCAINGNRAQKTLLPVDAKQKDNNQVCTIAFRFYDSCPNIDVLSHIIVSKLPAHSQTEVFIYYTNALTIQHGQ